MLRKAIRTDPHFFPAHYRYIKLMRLSGAAATMRAEYERAAAERPDPFFQCLAIVAREPLGYPQASHAALTALERRGHASACTAVALMEGSDLTPTHAWSEWALTAQRRAVESAPEIGETWRIYAHALSAQRGPGEAATALRRAIAQVRSPGERVVLHLTLATMLERNGDKAAAHALRAAVAVAAERDGRRGVVALAVDPAATGGGPGAVADGRRRQMFIARRASAGWPWELVYGMLLGSTLSDGGDPAAALPPLDRAVYLADSARRPQLTMVTYRLRGRVYSKMGRMAEAERDLRHAVELGEQLDEPYELAEVYHNLMHAYEGAGRFGDALSAADQFIALARPLRHAQPRVISLHDAGIVRWKAGRHASANAAFAEMTGVVDEQDRNHYWAGEFLERQGDYRAAIRYYHRGAAAGPAERSLNLAGLSRAYRALGVSDSALAAAAAHDSLLVDQLDVPMLPRILVEDGRGAEAIAIARSWANRRLRAGHVQGATLAALELCEILMAARRWREAVAEADRAAGLAARLQLTEELVRAERLRGLARVRDGDHEAGLADLRAAAARAAAHPTAGTVLESRMALAEGLDAAGKSSALAAYDTAARLATSHTARLELDVDRVRFHERYLAPFDGAIRLLLRQPAKATTAEQILSWSDRRKAAALRLVGHGPRSVARRPGRLPRLAGDEAIIDYSVLDETIIAVVLTSRSSVVLTLPALPDTVRAWAQRLRAPLATTYGGRLDLARAAYDLDLAHALYRAVLAPVLLHVGDARRLLISPDGPLHLVPFEALPTRNPANDAYAASRYVIDRWEIAFVPSVEFARGGREIAVQPGAPLLVLARDVPGGDAEVEAIFAMWPRGAVHALTGTAATEQGLTAHAPGRAILHLAVHATADDRDPAASHLQLAPVGQSDGRLDAGDIARLELNARVVFLSGCETMVGPLFAGEGRLGLARAFLSRGARAVVATDWPVGSTAADVARGFYSRIAAGEPTGAALRGAKLDLRRASATAHPFYWASYLLVIGANPRSREADSGS